MQEHTGEVSRAESERGGMGRYGAKVEDSQAGFTAKKTVLYELAFYALSPRIAGFIIAVVSVYLKYLSFLMIFIPFYTVLIPCNKKLMKNSLVYGMVILSFYICTKVIYEKK